MSFSNSLRKFFIFLILFGLWTSWRNSKYKIFAKLYSICSLALIAINFSLAISFDKLYEFNTLSNMVANCWFVLSIVAHLIIVVESILQNKLQSKLIQRFSVVDRIFAKKLHMKIAYPTEKTQLFVIFFVVMAIEIGIKIFFVAYTTFYHETLHISFYVTLHSELMIVLRLAQIQFFAFIIYQRLCLINKKLIQIKMEKQMPNYRIILHLKKIYDELYGISHRISRCFQWSLLIIIVNILANFSLHFYWMFLNFGKNYGALFNSISFVRFFIELGSVGMCCSLCFQQVCQ